MKGDVLTCLAKETFSFWIHTSKKMSHFLYLLTTVSNQRKLSNFKSSKLDSQRSNFCAWELTKFFPKVPFVQKKCFHKFNSKSMGLILETK